MTYEAAFTRAKERTAAGNPTVPQSCAAARGGWITRPVPFVCKWPRGIGGKLIGRDAREHMARPDVIKLTEDQVREIRAMYRCGAGTQKEIAQAYGVASATVYAIVRGWTWRDVDGPASRIPKPVAKKDCEFCGQPFETHDLRKRFCQERCESRAAKKRVLAKLRAATRLRVGDKRCDFCGRGFDARHSRARWCTAGCRARAYAERRGVLIEPRAVVRKNIEVPA